VTRRTITVATRDGDFFSPFHILPQRLAKLKLKAKKRPSFHNVLEYCTVRYRKRKKCLTDPPSSYFLFYSPFGVECFTHLVNLRVTIQYMT